MILGLKGLNIEEFLRSVCLHTYLSGFANLFSNCLYYSHNPYPNATKSREENYSCEKRDDCYLGQSQGLIKLTDLRRLLAKERSIKCRTYHPKAY